MVIFLKSSVSVLIISQLYFAFGYANEISCNKRNSSAELKPNERNISFVFFDDKSFCPRIRYNKADIWKTLHSTLQHKENVFNITRDRVSSTSKLRRNHFRYYHVLSTGNSIELNGSSTSNIEDVLSTRNKPDQMGSTKSHCQAETIKMMSVDRYSSNERAYSAFSKIESVRNLVCVVFVLLGFILTCYSIFNNEFGPKPLACTALFSLLGIASGFEIFSLSLVILFGGYISYETVPKLYRFFASVHGDVFSRKLKILSVFFCIGLANLVVFQIAFKVVLVACINNFIVFSACYLLLKEHNFENSLSHNSEGLRLHSMDYNRIGSLDKRIEHISVVGISCRFANGVNSKDEFWDLLFNGGCVIGSYPENRLEALAFKRFYNPARNVSGKHYTLKGAFLDEISGFDAQFFGISPAECRAMDPQQRLLLQSVYEAIDDAGLRLEDLQTCRTGVYVGLMNLDYGRLLLDDGNVPNIDEFASTGITASTAANRISFSLDLNGPSLTVDTACSSSLSALNIAVTHLKSRECDVAIVCAPNLILARYFHTACCRTGLLAEDGRCKSFDARGDGYGRGEGMAVVVLKATHLALMDRDEPYAQIIGCGLNNDGQAAIPMTAPSDKMQAKLARRVLKETGLRKTDIQYVETHGTGTAVGDVVEMRSVSDVYANTSSRVLRIGSVKSNINHTESTAGLAGLIKVCLMIKNGYFVPTVNIQELKPQLKIAERKMLVQTELEPWPAVDGKPRTAAVCSYGYGGANAHVIVQEVQSTASTESCARKREVWVLTLSARCREALRMTAGKISEWLEQKRDDDCLLKGNVCYTLNNRRSIHFHKLALTFNSFEQAANVLKRFVKDSPGWEKHITVNDNCSSVKKLAFLYGGQGNCWYDMALGLMKNEPRFVKSIQQIDEILEKLQTPWRLVEILGGIDRGGLSIQDNTIAQMALFGVHYGMTQLLKSWGITPSAVVGHSLGEISAACAAHVISLEEAVQLILLRAGLQHRCSMTGCMLAVGMSPESAERVVRSLELATSVSVAAINSPVSVVLSGDQQSMLIVEEYLQKQLCVVFCKRLGSTRAFHSQEMDCIKEEFEEGFERLEISPGRPRIPFYSTVTGTQTSNLTPTHWWNNIREPVLFCSAVHSMISDGHKAFIEINVAPQFPRYIQEISSSFESENAAGPADVTLIETFPRKSENHRYSLFLRNCPSTLFTRGFPIAWDKIQGSGTRTFIRCPSYPWQERKYWYRECEPAECVGPLARKTDLPATPDESNFNRATLNSGLIHPLLGKAVATNAYSGIHAWTSEIDVFALPYLKDHRFLSSEDSVIPGAVYVEMSLALVLQMYPDVLPRLHDITFEHLLTLSANEIARLCTRLDTTGRPGARHVYQITIVEENGNEVLVARGLASFEETTHHSKKVTRGTSNSAKISKIKSRLTKQPLEIFNKERVSRRFSYGPQFSLIEETWCSKTEAFCSVVLTDEIRSSLGVYVVHPAIIDACFQTLFLLENSVEEPVPYGAADIQLHRRHFTDIMYCHVVNHVEDHVTNPDSSQEHVCDIALMDCHGNVLLLIEKFKMVDLSNLRPTSILGDVSYQIQWQHVTAEAEDTIGHKVWVIIPDHCGFAEMFTSALPKGDPKFIFEFPEKSWLTRNAFLEVLEKAVEALKCGGFKRICIVSFLPVDSRSLIPDWKNFNQAHYQAFESSLILLQSVLVSEHSESVQLVLVTCGSIALGISHGDSPAFPWSGTLLGFRRTLAEELTSPKTTIIDLQENPSEAEFRLMLGDLQREEIAEEIVYRDGRRYLNQIKRFRSARPENVEQQSEVDCRESEENFSTDFINSEGNLKKSKLLLQPRNRQCEPICRQLVCNHLSCRSSSIFDSLSSSYEEDVLANAVTTNDSLAVPTTSFESKKTAKEFKFSSMPFDPTCLKGDRSYLVVGGVRGFGFEVVYWLLQNGAKTIICTARSAPSQSKMAEVTRLEKETGAKILLRQADVTSWKEMLKIVKELEELPRLAGIVFTAMVLDDQRIKEADLETCARVVATKVQGSVILHQLSLRFVLDFFVMFSSVAGILGNVGQLAYSAANTFLDSLCEYRLNRLGLPALSVAWGTMGGAGILERSKDIANLFQSYGFRIMSCKQGLKFLEEFLAKHSDQSQIIICDIDWSTYLKSSAYILHRSPRLQSLDNETLARNKPNDIACGMTLQQLACIEPQQRRKVVEDFIRRLLSTWTEADCHEVDLNLALYKYGVDSIGAANMSLRIRNGIGAIFEIYYFIQPKTTGVTIINDTLEQVRNFQRDHLDKESDWNRKRKVGDDSNGPCGITGDELKTKDGVKVVPLHVPEDALIKVFMMHSSHKSALANSPFASGFRDQETVALYSIGTDDVILDNEDYGIVRTLAEQYIALIKSAQRIGPYYFAGFSFGGILCYEIACQMTQDGEDVAMVIMLDTMPWFPKTTAQEHNPELEKFKDFLAADLKNKMVERFLKSTALGGLGYTQAEFEDLYKELGPGDKLFSVLKEKAQKINVSLDDVRAHVTSLGHQSERACHAHFEWHPPEVRYKQTVSYVRCEIVDETERPLPSWNPVELWGSLTNNIDVITLPSSHFELLDQPFAEICGLVILATAVMKHRSLAEWQPSPRSNQVQRVVNFLKSSTEIVIVCDDDLMNAKMWLNEEESRISICYEDEIRRKKIEFHLSDIRNIIPGKYSTFDCKRKMNEVDKNLMISLILSSDQQYHIVCQDWQQRDCIMDAFEVLFEIPLVRFSY